jgi:trehalose-phosphatase
MYNKINKRAKVSFKSSPLNKIFLFSDFDGTLVPIRKDPQKVVLSLSAQKVLRLLSEKIPIAIVSGRSLNFLQKKIAIPKIFLAGNHGLEIKMGKDQFVHPQARSCKIQIKRLVRSLKKIFLGTDGVLIEDKGLTLTLHYRLVVPRKREAVCNLFYDYFKIFNEAERLKISKGKMSLEIRPNIDWGKKDAIRWILEMYKKRFPKRTVIPIYIGDDETDRAALAWIKKIGLSIFVGDAKVTTIKATYFLPSQGKCIELLRQIQLELGDDTAPGGKKAPQSAF